MVEIVRRWCGGWRGGRWGRQWKPYSCSDPENRGMANGWYVVMGSVNFGWGEAPIPEVSTFSHILNCQHFAGFVIPLFLTPLFLTTVGDTAPLFLHLFPSKLSLQVKATIFLHFFQSTFSNYNGETVHRRGACLAEKLHLVYRGGSSLDCILPRTLILHCKPTLILVHNLLCCYNEACWSLRNSTSSFEWPCCWLQDSIQNSTTLGHRLRLCF